MSSSDSAATARPQRGVEARRGNLAIAHERELEQGLIDHVQRFLMELGVGFAFVGRQVHIEVADEDFYVDLLLYHLKLRCFVVIDLKAVAFRPEFAGKMNFYLSAVDTQSRLAVADRTPA